MRRIIKVKLKREQLEALFLLSNFYVSHYDPVGFGNLIAKELLLEVSDRMQAMIENWEQKKFTLRLTPAQSLAFYAFWAKVDLSRHPYEMVIIYNIFESINKSNPYENAFS